MRAQRRHKIQQNVALVVLVLALCFATFKALQMQAQLEAQNVQPENNFRTPASAPNDPVRTEYKK